MSQIRVADPADRADIITIATDSLYAAYGSFADPAQIANALDEWYDPAVIEVAIEHADIHLVVFETDDAIIGFGSAEQTWADEVEIHMIAVHPDNWGSGYGSEILADLLRWAENQTVDRVACSVFAENYVGTSFFTAHDFSKTGETVGSIGTQQFAEYEYILEL